MYIFRNCGIKITKRKGKEMGKKNKEDIADLAVMEETVATVAKETTDTVTKVSAEDTGGSLARIEKLLEQQNEYSHKLLKRANVRTIAVAIFAAVAVVCMIVVIVLYGAISQALVKLPPLIDSAETLVETINTDVSKVLNETLNDIQKIDFDTMNGAISGIKTAVDGIGKVDFGALNGSIQNLQDGTNGFKDFVDGLKNFKLF